MDQPPQPQPAGPRAQQPPSVGGFGMFVLLATLGMLFASSLFFFILKRMQAEHWPPPGAPALPALFWLSTALLLVSSFTMHGALRAARHARDAALKLNLGVTMLLGIVFLVNQVFCWLPLIGAKVSQSANLFMLAFLMLAVLHGLHVIGGLIPLGVITAAAARGVYTARAHSPVHYLAIYWHFLDVVWLIVFVTLLVSL